MLNSYRLLRNNESTLSLHHRFPSHQPSPTKNNKIEFISPINGNQLIPKSILYTPQANNYVKNNDFKYYNSLNDSDVLNNSNSVIKINDIFKKRKYPLINFHRSKSKSIICIFTVKSTGHISISFKNNRTKSQEIFTTK